jgi:hypothetical protein
VDTVKKETSPDEIRRKRNAIAVAAGELELLIVHHCARVPVIWVLACILARLLLSRGAIDSRSDIRFYVIAGGENMTTQPAKAQEPSMEDILASIRRTIAANDAANPLAKAADSLAAAPLPSPHVAEGRVGAPPQFRAGQQSVTQAQPAAKQDEVTAGRAV